MMIKVKIHDVFCIQDHANNFPRKKHTNIQFAWKIDEQLLFLKQTLICFCV